MQRPLTLMAVHAHPDDEVIGTGGILSAYADEGITTVLVTCTDGGQGDGPDGVKPGEPGHDEAAVAERRLAELRESVGHLGVTHVELLGYRDSGMVGWPANDHPEAFFNAPVEGAAARLAELVERYRPHVIVTYDENGGYGHPDHIQAHRIAVRAAEMTGIPDKFYYSAAPRSRMLAMVEHMKAMGMGPDFEPPDDFGTPDELVTAEIDVSAHSERKLKALRAHASQGDSAMLLAMPPEAQQLFFAAEFFTRAWSRVDAPDLEDDLFAGLRG
ncbi:PIG-L family deacetylase [Microbispora sp. RL4-1S]|uniref:PIG-L family deacetylase n=1 Tax=Microbispora oryzae TaxID=2806554 RepID=A0A940WLG8_9ACTN|nr:PIG-L family deacetylase [Microbispora oryzae]MBP2705532.1 PIG-L family deacetylase [Microbispora oryzae]